MTTLFISHSSKDKDWALQVHDKLRRQGYDKLFLDSHPEDGIPVGDKWEQTLWQHLRQSGAVIVLCTGNWITSPWCVAEAMIARERGKPVFMLASEDIMDGQVKGPAAAGSQIPDFLKDTQFISLAGATMDEAYQRLWRGLAALRKDIFPLPDQPYPGLMAFDEKDAAVLFGRDAEIAKVNEVLSRRRRNNAYGFIVVLGASGCGKSSLVRAGVLPQLKRPSDGDDSGSRWVILPPFMGGKGLEGLTISLATGFKDAGQPTELASIRRRLEPMRESNGGMERAVRALRELASELLFARGFPERAVLLVLDQLEEVFATAEGSDARAILRLLLEASTEAGGSVVILATMRSDFLNAFQLFEGAAERYEEITLDPMPRSRFSEVIKGPADRFGLRLEAGLSERLVEDTEYTDALPLLAFTLEKLYKKCKSQGRLTLKAYDELGGVSAAIKHAANGILEETDYAGLPADDPRMRDLRSAFYRLARVGEEGQFTRRIARWSRMPPSCAEVLKRFVDQRLLVSGAEQKKENKEKENSDPTLSVAHEALFRVWDTLHGWLLQDRKALTLRAQIEEAAADWEAANLAESRAWPEERILDAVREIRLSGVSLDDVDRPDVVRAFLGPTDPHEIARLLNLTAVENATAGSGRHGDAWHLPLSHKARVSVGVRLALLGGPAGDRRKGVGVSDGLPDIDWVKIAGGQVTIEIKEDPNDMSSKIIRYLTRPVAPFWMARYPVTIAQFQAFLKSCYSDGEWHLPEHFMIDPTKVGPPSEYPGRHGNHPVDFVTWYHAAAFCHWLGTRLYCEIRLPTEFEWQLAATGGDPNRTFPWGPNWDPNQEPWRANTSESGLGRSTAVGMYPKGASVAGLQDMIGTVWEWCWNLHNDPEDDGAGEAAAVDMSRTRALRGGSWLNESNRGKSVDRSRNSATGRTFNVGFRVVSLSPPQGADH